MAGRPGSARAREGTGAVARLFVVTACLIVLGVVFTLGVLVGRQWAGGGAAAVASDA